MVLFLHQNLTFVSYYARMYECEKGVFVMKINQQKTLDIKIKNEDMQCNRNEILSLLAYLYFNLGSIPWKQALPFSIFLKQNASLELAEIEEIAGYLFQMHQYVVNHLDDLQTPNFKTFMFQSSSSLISLSTLNAFYKSGSFPSSESSTFLKLFSSMQEVLKKNKRLIYEYVLENSDIVLNKAQDVIENEQICEFPVKLTWDEQDDIFFVEYYKEYLNNSYNDKSLNECYEDVTDYRMCMSTSFSSICDEDSYDGQIEVLYFETKQLGYKLHVNQKRLMYRDGMELTIKRANRLRLALENRLSKTTEASKRELLEDYLTRIDTLLNHSLDYRLMNSGIDEMKEELLKRVRNKEL